MGSPTIFSGRYTKLLTNQGILNSNGSVNNYDGNKNYIPYAQFEQNVTTGWSLFNTTLTSGLPTGSVTGGAASITTFATTGTNPLAGTYSLQIAGSAAISAGQGFISSAFTVDRCDYGKVLTFKFCYEAVTNPTNANWSGVLGSQSFAIYIYDVTASAWVQPTGFLGMNQSLNAGQVTGTFQSSVVSGQQYQIAVICLQATAGAMTINFDSISVSPQVNPIGTVSTTSAQYVPTIAGVTISSPIANYWRFGDRLFVSGSNTLTAAAATTFSITLPAGLTIDYAKLSGVNNTYKVGELINVSSGATFASTGGGPFILFVDGTTSNQVFFAEATSGSTLVKSTGSANLGATANISYEFSVPISGWSSNVQMSNDTDTKVVSLEVGGAAASATANNPIIFPTIGKDTNAGYNATTGQYTASITGFYQVNAFIDASTVALNSRAYVSVAGNTAAGYNRPLIGQNYLINSPIAGGGLVFVNAGQTIDVRCDNATGALSASSTMSIYRLSGPSVIAANETVAASYYSSAATSSISTTLPCNFDAKEFDLNNAVTTGSAWKFTAPISGTYQFSGTIYIGITSSQFQLYKNGTVYKQLMFYGSVAGGNTGQFSSLVRLSAGDYIDVRPSGAQTLQGGTLSGTTGNTPSNISILRVGN
jgi:hypothetical protein